MRNVYGRHSLALLLVFSLAVGCAQTRAPKWPTWLGGKKEEEHGPKVVTPRDKMEQLRELSAKSKKMTPELQVQVAGELAQGIAHEKDAVVRAQILRTLGHFPTEKSQSMLTAGLHDPERDVRIAACEGLGNQGGDIATQALAQTLKDDADIDVRLAAARAMGQTASAGAVPALGDALEDPDVALQHRAMASMKKVSGKDFGNDVGAWRVYAKTGHEPEQPSLVTRFLNYFR